MGHKNVTQATIGSQAALLPHQEIEEIAIFNGDGTPFTGVTKATVATAIGTATKTTQTPQPPANSLVAITFTNGNSAEIPTVNFNGAGARSIKLGGTAVDADFITVAAGAVVVCYFDGSALHLLGRQS